MGVSVAIVVGVTLGAGVSVGWGVKVMVGERVGSLEVCVEEGAIVATGVAISVAVACAREDGVSVAGTTGVLVNVGAKVAVTFGAALLQAESSRTRKRKVSFFILSILQTN
jgi:hypothetical protein